MNYFAHAHVAAAFSSDRAFVLGAMLPDFAGMLGARIHAIDHPRLRAGETHHHRQDQAFHRAPTFCALVVEGAQRLRRHGVARGPSRGAAHVGIELLLDGVLVGDAASDGAYLDALGDAPALDAAIRWGRRDDAERWLRLRERLRDAGLPHALRDPARVALRVARALGSRPALRLSAHEHAPLERWLRDARAEVEQRAPTLLEETLARLSD